jgi:hypothetical protein
MTKVEITVSCTQCGTVQKPVKVQFSEFHNWTRGLKVQQAFPYLTSTERELLISGTCAKCWDDMFKEPDDDEGGE